MMVLFLIGLLIGLLVVEVVEITSRHRPRSSPSAVRPDNDPAETRWTALDDRQFARAVNDSCA